MYTIWLTGLSGAGKTTIADAFLYLYDETETVIILDGDKMRKGLCSDLGFSPEDRAENIRRIAETAKLINDAGDIVVVACISPYAADRANAKKIIGADRFVEVYVDTPLAECIRRDVKGLYKQVSDGKLSSFTGISAPYEPPEKPNVIINTLECTPKEAAKQIINHLRTCSDF